jgi:general secretion pathway protein C
VSVVVKRLDHNQSMWVRISAFAIWALVAASLVFWALRLLVAAPAAPAHTVSVATGAVARADLSRLFGAPAVAAAVAAADPEISSRFKLMGVMAPKSVARLEATGQGIALIAVDGKPARAFSVGSTLDSGLVLQAVSLRSASIGPQDGATALKLEIPPLPPPATGALPALSFNSSGAANEVKPATPLPPTMVSPPPGNVLPPASVAPAQGAAAPPAMVASPAQLPPQGAVLTPGVPAVPSPAGAAPGLVPPPPGADPAKPPAPRSTFGNAQR